MEATEGNVQESVVEKPTQPVEAKSEPTKVEIAKSDAKEEKKERPKSIRSNLRTHLRQKDSETEAAKPSAQLEAPRPVASAEDVEVIAPPNDMDASERAHWESLPRDVQKYLSRRAYEMRSEYTKKTMALGEKERGLSGVLEAVAPVQDEYARKGVSIADLVRRSVAWDKAFATAPIEAAIDYLDAYGIDPAELVAAKEQNGQTHQPPVNIEQLKEQAREEARQEMQRLRDEQTTHQNYNLVQQFISSKPLFKDPGTAEQLEAAMAPIVAGLRQSNPNQAPHELLETAYNYVTRGNPQFSSLQQRLDAKAEAEKTKAEAEKAMQASRSISGGPGSGSPQRKIKDIRENLRLRYRGAL